MRFSSKQIAIYLFIAFVIPWSLWAVLYIQTKDVTNQALIVTFTFLFNAIAMWCPGLAVLVLWLMNGRQKTMVPSFNPLLTTKWIWYLIAWGIPVISMVVGGICYFIVFPGDLTFSFDVISKAAQEAGSPISSEYAAQIALIQILSALTIGPLINIFLAVGEEIGWRGFLYPALAERFRPAYAHVAMGLIWGIWHTPINAMGHNYGVKYVGYPYLGIVVMCVFTFGIGVFLSFITERSGSIWPAALCHGAVNAVGGIPVLFNDPALPHQLLGPHLSGLIASLPLALAALWVIKTS